MKKMRPWPFQAVQNLWTTVAVGGQNKMFGTPQKMFPYFDILKNLLNAQNNIWTTVAAVGH